MKSILHTADSRGHADHGWLNSHHSFSFANYYDPEKMNFGALRVLNDDSVAPGKGFGKHPHQNMEIVSIPLEGDLEHNDSLRNSSVIREGDIQVMSAGTGIFHSEYNHSDEAPVKFLQIWIIPDTQGVEPRYDQMRIADLELKDGWRQLLSPSKEDDGVWIHQQAWFYMGEFDKEQEATYELKKGNDGVYLFVLEGELNVDDQALGPRDALGIWDTQHIKVKAKSKCRVLLMEVPLQF